MLRPVLVAAPGATLWTIDEVKARLRVDGDDENDVITAMLAAAIGYLDGYAGILGRCIINQSWKQSFGCFERHLRLPFPDVSGVALKYFDTANAEQTVDPANYQMLDDDRGSFLRLSSAFGAPAVFADRRDPVSVTLVAGFGAAATDVPAALRHAVLLLVGHWYANREAVSINAIPSALPLGFDALIAPFRRNGV